LFDLLNKQLVESASPDQSFVVPSGADVLCTLDPDKSSIAPCNHEEADSRIMVHVADAVMKGFSNIIVHTVDRDVIVLAIAAVQKLGQVNVWVAFGSGKHFSYIPVHEICTSPNKSLALPVFHAFTGCDTVSFFANVGKKSAWKVWQTHDEFTNVFMKLSNAPKRIRKDIEDTLEYFAILLYDKSCMHSSINSAQKNLFVQKSRPISALPPTKAALQQHIRRAVLQGGHHWGNTTKASRQLPSPSNCLEKWAPLWTELPETSCPELLPCRCRNKCATCKCAKAMLPCTAYCTCKGDCDNHIKIISMMIIIMLMI